MRKILLLIAALLIVGTATTQAQILKFGVIGGANSHALEFDAVKIGDATISQIDREQYGYQLGAVLRISLPSFIQIQTELIYKETNSRILVNNGSNVVSTSMSMSSWELPVMIGFNIRALRLFCGPVYRLSTDIDFTQKYNKMSATMSNNVGLQAGAGIDLGKFFIDCRYSTFYSDNKFALNVNGSSGIIKTTSDKSWIINCGLFF